MIYTIAKIREYARSVDNRLEDTDKYSDTWIDDRIEEGLALAQDIHQIFYTTELYDLTTNTDPVSEGGDGLTEVEIIAQEEPHSIYEVECDLNYFTVEPTANNHVIVRVKANAPDVLDKTVLVRYFFYPTLPITQIEMSMEMYKLCKACIASNCFAMLSDEANEKYHMAKAEAMNMRGTFDILKDVMDVPPERLWSGSWA